MNNLGTIPLVETPVKEVTASTPLNTQEFLFNLYMTNPKFWGRQFKKMAKMDIGGIILNPNLTTAQKFYKIFGLKLQETLSGYFGDIFSDVGNWFNNTFSQQNLTNWQNQINATNQGISNFLQLMRNLPNLSSQVQQQQKVQDIQTQTILQTKNFVETYSMPIIVGLGVVLLIVVMKKK